MWRHGHRVLAPYPCAFGHETAGVRIDTGERVLVSDSVACGDVRSVPRRPRADLPRPDLGARRLRRADRGAGRRRSTRSRTAFRRRRRRWPSRSRPRSTRSARGSDADRRRHPRRRPDGADADLAAGRAGAKRDPRRPAPGAARAGDRTGRDARGEPRGQHELVFEAVGRPEAWRAAAAAAAPGGVVVLVGGCPSGTEITLPTGPLHYEELELRGSFHHSPDEVDQRARRARGRRAPVADAARPDDLARAAAGRARRDPNGGPAKKWVVDPRGS